MKDEKIKALYNTLKDHSIDYKKMKQLTGGELANTNFSDCSVAVLDSWAAKIYEYLSEEKTREFVNRITEAEISSEEYEQKRQGELIYDGDTAYDFMITLKNGEIIYLGVIKHNDIDMILINGYHGYPCDAETREYISECYREARERFFESALNQ